MLYSSLTFIEYIAIVLRIKIDLCVCACVCINFGVGNFLTKIEK